MTHYHPLRRKADSMLKASDKRKHEYVQAFTVCPCCSGLVMKWSRARKGWFACVGCLKHPGKQPIDKGFVFDEN